MLVYSPILICVCKQEYYIASPTFPNNVVDCVHRTVLSIIVCAAFQPHFLSLMMRRENHYMHQLITP